MARGAHCNPISIARNRDCRAKCTPVRGAAGAPISQFEIFRALVYFDIAVPGGGLWCPNNQGILVVVFRERD